MSENYPPKTHDEGERLTTALLGHAVPAAVAVFGLACFINFAAGESPEPRTLEAARMIADEHYYDSFSKLSPADKFTTQYAADTTIRIDNLENTGRGFRGALSRHVNKDYAVAYNNGCLANTAYDIDGGNFEYRAKGLLFHAEAQGSIPTAAATAEINPENPDQLLVVSGSSNPNTLVFDGLSTGSALVPADETTNRILETHGCSTGIQSVEEKAHNYFYYKGVHTTVK